MPSVVALSGVSFELSNGRLLFHNLSFSLDNKVTALVGPNGIGKTCLARLLAGLEEPTEGRIRRNASIAFFAQRQAPPSITVDEFLSRDYRWSVRGEKLLQDIDRQTPCTHISGGQWMRVRLAMTLGEQFLILDEPTNDLDRDGRETVLEFIRDSENGALLISHDRECLGLCDEVLELSNNGLAKFGGGWTEYERAKKLEREALESALESAKNKRDAASSTRHTLTTRQEKRNRQGARVAARGGIPKILLGARKRRAQSTTGRVDASTLERADDAVRAAHDAFSELKLEPSMYADLVGSALPARKLVAEARGFNIRFDDWLYSRDLEFAWRGNVRIALKGGNGSGKSTLLRAIMGTTFETRGELRRSPLTTLYIDQRCEMLDDTKSILANVRDGSPKTESEIRTDLARFLFVKDSVFQKVGSLSGGERLRAALARGLMAVDRPELLILDEPTNNLDLVNIEFLERLVREFRGALLMISHDETFLKNSEVTEELDLGR